MREHIAELNSSELPDYWVRGKGVLASSQHDSLTILSLGPGKYFQLSGTAMELWNRLADGSAFSLVLSELCTGREELERHRITSVCTATVLKLRRMGFLVPFESADVEPARSLEPVKSSGHLPEVSVLRCVGTLFYVWLLTRYRGFGRAVTICASTPVLESPQLAPHAWLRRLARQAAIAGTVLPVKAKCLELSLCVVHIARSSGVDARLRLGVVGAPFQGHAWAEYHGEPINDTSDNLRLYRSFLDLDRELGVEA